MIVSLTDAATLLGKTPRQVRYLIKQGRLPAKKVGGAWRIDTSELPLTESQRAALLERVEAVQGAIAETLKPAAAAAQEQGRSASKPEKAPFMVTQLRPFQLGAAVYAEIVADDPARERLRQCPSHGTRACHAFHPGDKTSRLAEARDLGADVVTWLRLHNGDQGERSAWADRLEQDVLPAISRLLGAHERRARRRRFDSFVIGSAS